MISRTLSRKLGQAREDQKTMSDYVVQLAREAERSKVDCFELILATAFSGGAVAGTNCLLNSAPTLQQDLRLRLTVVANVRDRDRHYTPYRAQRGKHAKPADRRRHKPSRDERIAHDCA